MTTREWTPEDEERLAVVEKRIASLARIEQRQESLAEQQTFIIGWIISELGGQNPETGKIAKGSLRRLMEENQQEILAKIGIIQKQLNGNGKRGLLVRVEDIEKHIKEREGERAERKKENRKLWMGVIASIIVFVLQGVFMAIWMATKFPTAQP